MKYTTQKGIDMVRIALETGYTRIDDTAPVPVLPGLALLKEFARLQRIEAALVELVTLHDDRPADYETRKPLAWEQARKALKEMQG